MTFIFIMQEAGHSLVNPPHAGGAESTIANLVLWLKLIVETLGACIIGLGILSAAYQFARAMVPPQVESYNGIRLTLARYLALALEFQLGADILSTAIAPSWDQIGKLGAIAVIRTVLNYFLTREMREERGGAVAPVQSAHQGINNSDSDLSGAETYANRD